MPKNCCRIGRTPLLTQGRRKGSPCIDHNAHLSWVAHEPRNPARGATIAGMGQFADLVTKTADELGLAEIVSATESDKAPSVVVTISYPQKRPVRTELSLDLFLDPELKQLKLLLMDLAARAMKGPDVGAKE